MYSAIISNPFPIIYKLDRDNGNCDVITMDWLLTHFNRPSQSNSELLFLRRYLDLPVEKIGPHKEKSKPTSALTSALIDMVVREGKQRGYGVRMFVQACILSGCDYAPSRLNGIGLVNAFRMVKDFANRDANDRFSIILRSLPSSKISSTDCTDATSVDKAIRDYEDILARSEVAFYFHQVLDWRTRRLVSLSSSNHHVDDKINPILPSLKRFNNDLTFIGCEGPTHHINDKITSPATMTCCKHKKESADCSKYLSPKEDPSRTYKRRHFDNKEKNLPGRKEFLNNPFSEFGCDSEKSIPIQGSQSMTHTISIIDDDDDGPNLVGATADISKTSIRSLHHVDYERDRHSSLGLAAHNKKRVLSRVSETIERIEQSVITKTRKTPFSDFTNNSPGKPIYAEKSTHASRKKVMPISAKTTKAQVRSHSIESFFKPLFTN